MSEYPKTMFVVRDEDTSIDSFPIIREGGACWINKWGVEIPKDRKGVFFEWGAAKDYMMEMWENKLRDADWRLSYVKRHLSVAKALQPPDAPDEPR